MAKTAPVPIRDARPGAIPRLLPARAQAPLKKTVKQNRRMPEKAIVSSRAASGPTAISSSDPDCSAKAYSCSGKKSGSRQHPSSAAERLPAGETFPSAKPSAPPASTAGMPLKSPKSRLFPASSPTSWVANSVR